MSDFTITLQPTRPPLALLLTPVGGSPALVFGPPAQSLTVEMQAALRGPSVTINGVSADGDGNITIGAADVGADPAGAALLSALIFG